MAIELALNTSPSSALEAMRGEIVDAQIGYPEVLQLKIQDHKGREWVLATQDASYSLTDPQFLIHRQIESASIQNDGHLLTCALSGGARLDIRASEEDPKFGDPPYWELLSPFGVVLQFGPGMHWQINDAAGPVRRED